jgi:hypothetical protein
MSVEQKSIRENPRNRFEDIPCLDWNSHDLLDAIGWPLTLVWAGVVLLLAINFGYSDEQGWSLFFVGAGTLVLFGVAIRLLVPAYRRPVFGDLIWAGILLGLGTGSGLIWALILLGIGASILTRGIFRDPESI